MNVANWRGSLENKVEFSDHIFTAIFAVAGWQDSLSYGQLSFCSFLDNV